MIGPCTSIEGVVLSDIVMSPSHGRDNRDWHDVICSKVAHSQIVNRVEIGSVMNRSSMMIGTMAIIAPTMTNHTGSVL
jgi:hypothetical protein